MDAPPTTSRPSSPHISPQARTFLDARLTEQSTELTSLESEFHTLSVKLDGLKEQHSSTRLKTTQAEVQSFGQAVKNKVTEQIHRIVADFDSRDLGGEAVKEKVLGRVWLGIPELLAVRTAIIQLDYLCTQYEVKSQQGDGAARNIGTEGSGKREKKETGLE